MPRAPHKVVKISILKEQALKIGFTDEFASGFTKKPHKPLNKQLLKVIVPRVDDD